MLLCNLNTVALVLSLFIYLFSVFNTYISCLMSLLFRWQYKIKQHCMQCCNNNWYEKKNIKPKQRVKRKKKEKNPNKWFRDNRVCVIYVVLNQIGYMTKPQITNENEDVCVCRLFFYVSFHISIFVYISFLVFFVHSIIVVVSPLRLWCIVPFVKTGTAIFMKRDETHKMKNNGSRHNDKGLSCFISFLSVFFYIVFFLETYRFYRMCHSIYPCHTYTCDTFTVL